MDNEWKNDNVSVKIVEERIIILKFVVQQDIFNVTSAYIPQIRLA